MCIRDSGYNLFNASNGNGNKRSDTRLTHISENYTNIYEDYSYYFINFDKGEGKRITIADVAVPSKVYTTVSYTHLDVYKRQVY